MRKHTWVVAVILLLIVCAGAWFFFDSLAKSKHLATGIESRQEFQISIADARRMGDLGVPILCFFFLPTLSWMLANWRLVTLSWLRSVIAVLLVVLAVFFVVELWMGTTLQERDATYFLPFSEVLGLLRYVCIWTMIWLAIWFGIERFYVAKRIAPNA